MKLTSKKIANWIWDKSTDMKDPVVTWDNIFQILDNSSILSETIIKGLSTIDPADLIQDIKTLNKDDSLDVENLIKMDLEAPELEKKELMKKIKMQLCQKSEEELETLAKSL